MSSPDLTDAEREAVLAVLRTPMLSMGPRIVAFEEAMCAFTGAKHAIGVNSGTAGLHLCVRAAGVKPGDRVITTPFSFVASANVLLFEQAIPIFVDVDPQTGNIDPQQVAEAAAALARNGSEAARSADCRCKAQKSRSPECRPPSARCLQRAGSGHSKNACGNSGDIEAIRKRQIRGACGAGSGNRGQRPPRLLR